MLPRQQFQLIPHYSDARERSGIHRPFFLPHALPCLSEIIFGQQRASATIFLALAIIDAPRDIILAAAAAFSHSYYSRRTRDSHASVSLISRGAASRPAMRSSLTLITRGTKTTQVESARPPWRSRRHPGDLSLAPRPSFSKYRRPRNSCSRSFAFVR